MQSDGHPCSCRTRDYRDYRDYRARPLKSLIHTTLGQMSDDCIFSSCTTEKEKERTKDWFFRALTDRPPQRYAGCTEKELHDVAAEMLRQWLHVLDRWRNGDGTVQRTERNVVANARDVFVRRHSWLQGPDTPAELRCRCTCEWHRKMGCCNGGCSSH
jgi:hypothetical protein